MAIKRRTRVTPSIISIAIMKTLTERSANWWRQRRSTAHSRSTNYPPPEPECAVCVCVRVRSIHWQICCLSLAQTINLGYLLLCGTQLNQLNSLHSEWPRLWCGRPSERERDCVSCIFFGNVLKTYPPNSCARINFNGYNCVSNTICSWAHLNWMEGTDKAKLMFLLPNIEK